MAENISLLNSNVRGLNDQARCSAVNALIQKLGCSLVCLQETKLAQVLDADCCEIAGPSFDGHAALNADGTRGGVLLLWRKDKFTVDNIEVRAFSVSARIAPVDGLPPWTVTTVYGRL